MTAEAGLGLFFLVILLYPLIMYGIFLFERHVEEEKRKDEERKKSTHNDCWNR